jgi:hypothetical protein
VVGAKVGAGRQRGGGVMGTGILTRGEGDVLLERERQREQWGDAHDSEHHGPTQLVVMLVVRVDGIRHCEVAGGDRQLAGSVRLKAKHDRRRQLVIAAALCIAEVDRLDREVG